MELLPPTGWADVATKHDLAHQTALADARLDALSASTDNRFDQLEDVVHTAALVLDARISTEIAGVRTDLHTEIGSVRTEIAGVRIEMHQTLRLHTLVTVGVLGTLISVVGALTGGG